jgi:hypothetical protein
MTPQKLERITKIRYTSLFDFYANLQMPFIGKICIFYGKWQQFVD